LTNVKAINSFFKLLMGCSLPTVRKIHQIM